MPDTNKQYKLVLFDVDGVLNDGTLWIGESGEVYKPFNAKDGFAFATLRQFGLKAGVLSGKTSEALRYRCDQLKMDIVLLGADDKWAVLSEYLLAENIQAKEVVFVGDDINDIDVISRVGYSYAPKDAHPLVLAEVLKICNARGGRGVAREVCEDVLMQMGHGLTDIYRPYLSRSSLAKYEQ
jgi:3-deoxy-D-manno-octulosonate 8-phosphate phosphatase (KDO 8-P phosphatase)